MQTHGLSGVEPFCERVEQEEQLELFVDELALALNGPRLVCFSTASGWGKGIRPYLSVKGDPTHWAVLRLQPRVSLTGDSVEEEAAY